MTAPLAVTVGDPAGIGPEIALMAARDVALRGDGPPLLLVGHLPTLRARAASLGLPMPEGAGAAVLAVDGPPEPFAPGVLSAGAGEQAFRAVERATRMAQAGEAAAVVTGPLNKEALHLAGHDFAGHTEMLAHLTGVAGSAMMLAHGDFRVSHVTTHVALQDVPRRATPARIERVVRLTHDALSRLGIARPRVAVAALNPHAGEGGAFGRHDIDVTAPLVAALRAEGLDVAGPVPGDTVFVRLRARAFDAVVAMYHDQGHIPVKLLGFAVDPATGAWTGLSGVNVTLGLPILRTSVDHGTAFDIAGTGRASAQSLVEAIDYAARLAPQAPARAAE